MTRADVTELADTIASQAERLRTELVQERVETLPFQEIQSLQRSLRTLEQELREPEDAVAGDAC